MAKGDGCAGVDLTPLAVLVLGLAAERPMHPYEMFQTIIERREDRFAKVRPGSLYHTVDRLHGRKLLLINGIQREGNRPERTIYSITDGGKRVLRDTLATMLENPAVEYPVLYLALAEAHALDRGEVVDLLTRRLIAMRAMLDSLAAEAAGSTERGVPELFLLDTGCRQAALGAQIDWLEKLRERLASGELMWLDEWLRHDKHADHHDESAILGRIARSQNEVDS